MFPSDTFESTETIKLPCDQCDFIALTKNSFNNHKRKHREKRFHCTQCDFKGLFKSNLLNHALMHNKGVSSFFCSFEGCSYSTVRRGDLTRHLLVHSEEKPYACPFCSETFRYYSDLQNHVRNHTGKKPLRCLVEGCGFSCRVPVEMRRHACTHTGEKPVKCYFEDCEFSCITEGQLKSHIYTHTGEKPFICGFKGCGYASADSSNLRKHVRTHTGEKPYRCLWEDCGYSSRNPSSLREHSIKHLIEISDNVQEFPGNPASQKRIKIRNGSRVGAGSSSSEGITATSDDPIKTYLCKICDFACTKKKLLKFHSGTHKVNGAYENKSSLNRPIPPVHFKSKSHSVSKTLTTVSKSNVPSGDERDPSVREKLLKGCQYPCKLCDFKTKRRKKFKAHLQEHRDTGCLFCSLCDFVCLKKKQLKRHLRSHNDTSCDSSTLQVVKGALLLNEEISPKEFSPSKSSVLSNCTEIMSGSGTELAATKVSVPKIKNKSILPQKNTNKNNILISSKKLTLPFCCNLCNRRFAREMSLLNHLRIHTGQSITFAPQPTT